MSEASNQASRPIAVRNSRRPVGPLAPRAQGKRGSWPTNTGRLVTSKDLIRSARRAFDKEGIIMPDHAHGPLQLGERAPNVVLDAITRTGKIAIDDFRGEKPVLVGLYRGLHCPFCRRHIATLSQLPPALNAKGIENFTVVNTPVERARLYLRYHPMVGLLAASDPERASHRAFGLPNIQFTDDASAWPQKVSTSDAKSMRVNLPGEMSEPMDPF